MTSTILKVALAPMQFSDRPAQKSHDVDTVLGLGFDVVMGTESGEEPLTGLIRTRGRVAGYVVNLRYSNWVAVRGDIVVPGSIERGFEPWVDAHAGVGKHSVRGLPWLSFEHRDEGVGRVSVAIGHMLTHGKTPDDPNWDLNAKFAQVIGDWGKKHGNGRGIALYGGDQNTDDRRFDTFRGGPFTSCWDVLDKYPKMPHGVIDVIAKYDKDRRVSFKAARTLRDGRLPLFADHSLSEADVEIQHR